MKNRMKRIAFTAMAAAITAAAVVPASAATLTLPSASSNGTHTYNIYQIFTGDFVYDKDEQGNTLTTGTLGNIKWGVDSTNRGNDSEGNAINEGDVVSDAITSKLTELASSNTTTDRDILDEITKYADIDGTSDLGDGYSGVAAGTSVEIKDGYYLVEDVTSDGVKSTYLLKAGGNITMTAKTSDTPTFDKDVKDDDTTADKTTTDTSDATAANNTDGWGESADHEINESFQFRLTATLPGDSDIDTYKAYQLKFVDTMNDGITYEQIDSVIVYYGTNGEIAIDPYDADDNVNGYVLATTTDDTTEKVTGFSLTINDLKKILPSGTSLQNVRVEVKYSAHLNENATISEDGSTITTTDKNVNGAYLEYTRNPEWNGEGKPENGQTEKDYNFVFTYKLDNTKVNDSQEVLPGARFILKGADKKTISLTKGADGYYYKAKDDDTVVEYMVSDANGLFNIKGLDAGTYYLEETQAPEGYAKLENDIEIVITADHQENNNANAVVDLTKTVAGKSIGSNASEIVNKKPSNLPSTGGVGTFLLYAVGGAMVIGAGATLAAKKRVEKK